MTRNLALAVVLETATPASLNKYFDTLQYRIDSERLTEISLPGEQNSFFLTDEEAGIEIKNEYHSMLDDYRLKLPH